MTATLLLALALMAPTTSVGGQGLATVTRCPAGEPRFPMPGARCPVPTSPSQAPVTAPVSPAASAAGGGDVWLVIYSVMPDKGPQFEGIARQVREALAKSPQDVRQAQARELRIHRSALPAQDGKLMYFLQIPALTGDADRSGFDALIDAVLPEQATALKMQLQGTLNPANPSGNTYLINVR